ncbi:hypothetical protein AB4178_07470 [Vibrio splendidus]
MRKLEYLTPIPDTMNPSKKAYKDVVDSNIVVCNSTIGNKANFDFRAYESRNNKNSIRKVADECCGYCGIRITSQNYIEVEHYRPKNLLLHRGNEFLLHKTSNHTYGISGTTSAKFGYYRLGNNYSNMLPSCSACNKGSGNSSIIIGKSIVHGIKFGKGNYFPILFKNRRGIKTDPRINSIEVKDISNEYSLLFNPYIDEPKKLFRYSKPELVENIQIIKIHAARDLNKNEKIKACVSINLLGLNRIGLCKDRMSIYIRLLSLKRNIAYDNDNDIRDINRWAEHANIYVNFFCKKSAGHIGFSQFMGEKIGEYLKRMIQTTFPTECHNTFRFGDDFNDVIKDLTAFSEEYYDIEQNYDLIDDLLPFS